MNEDEFWQYIDLIDWKANQHYESIVEALSTKNESEINSFYNILSEKLYFLDTIKHAENLEDYSYSSEEFSEDLFLYFRCMAVAKGKNFYYQVLNNPKLMPGDTAEELLTVVPKAFQISTGQKWKRKNLSGYSIETFSNEAGWEFKILSLKKVINA